MWSSLFLLCIDFFFKMHLKWKSIVNQWKLVKNAENHHWKICLQQKELRKTFFIPIPPGFLFKDIKKIAVYFCKFIAFLEIWNQFESHFITKYSVRFTFTLLNRIARFVRYAISTSGSLSGSHDIWRMVRLRQADVLPHMPVLLVVLRIAHMLVRAWETHINIHKLSPARRHWKRNSLVS